MYHLSLSQKIGGGYFLSLGIATIGIISGFAIGDYRKYEAENLRSHTQEEIRMLNGLENQILQAQCHQYHFADLVNKPEDFKQNQSAFLQNRDSINIIWNQVDEFINKRNLLAQKSASMTKSFIQEYKLVYTTYFQQVDELLIKINHLNLEQRNKVAGKLLLNLDNSYIAIKVDRSTSKLNNLIELVYKEHEHAENILKVADEIRSQIIALSVLLSVIIAIITTHTVTKPIITLTSIAHQVVEETNFDLRIPNNSGDEVSVLAASFNQLIQWVSEYIQKLEQARAVLEIRVQERTEELSLKNQQLQQARAVLEIRVQERTEELSLKNQQLQRAHDQLNQTLNSLKLSQSQLIQTEKMSSLGQMVAGIAHEVNNPINFIYGNLEYVDKYVENLVGLVALYQQEYPDHNNNIQKYNDDVEMEFIFSDLPKILSSMKIGVERIRQLVLSLRNFSRLDEAEIKPVNINDGIDSTLLILSHRIKMGVSIIKQYSDLPLIECYSAQLNQVFMNIISNAIDELLSSVKATTKEIVIQTELVTSDQVRVRIQDNGKGIPPNILEKIFDPFFTTKPVGKGTGLGLAISYQIVEKHQGKIEVNSHLNQGTEFMITLPVHRSMTNEGGKFPPLTS